MLVSFARPFFPSIFPSLLASDMMPGCRSRIYFALNILVLLRFTKFSLVSVLFLLLFPLYDAVALGCSEEKDEPTTQGFEEM